MSLSKLKDDLDELLEYINAMNDDYGDYCNHLYSIGHTAFVMSEEFKNSYINELEAVLVNIRKNTQWVDHKETVINEYRVLEWIPYED